VGAAVQLVCEPIDQKRNPRVMIDAQFSVPFNVALGLVKKRVVFPDFNEQMFAAPEVRRLMNLTTCAVDPALDAQYPENWPARVEITLADGRTLAAETTHAKGDPRNPLTEDQVIEKHRSIVAGVVEPQTDDRICSSPTRWSGSPIFASSPRRSKASYCSRKCSRPAWPSSRKGRHPKQGMTLIAAEGPDWGMTNVP